MPAKAEKSTVRERVHAVLKLRLDGARHHDIMQYSAAQGWGLKARQVRTYTERADRLIYMQRDRDREKLFALREAQLGRLYAKAVRNEDVCGALGCLRELSKIQGLYPEQKVVIEQKGSRRAGLDGMSDEELERLAMAGVVPAVPITYADLERMNPADLVVPGA